jgi:hypothetical protein
LRSRGRWRAGWFDCTDHGDDCRRFDDEPDFAALELQRWPRNEYPLIAEAAADSGVYEMPALLRRQAD